MSVKLREKKLSNGQISFYLDIYHNKKRWYEFLEIHINPKKPTPDDKEKKRMAIEIRAKRENELIVQENGLTDKSKRKADCIEWIQKYYEGRGIDGCGYRATISNLKKYTNNKPLAFDEVTADWIKQYTKYLSKRVKNNTVRSYLAMMSTALGDAARDGIILVNPFSKVPKHEKVRIKDTFRQAFSFDTLQLLVDTSAKIKPQYKQAYLFACFTGLRWCDVNPLLWTEIITKTIDGKEEWIIYFSQEKTSAIEYMPLSEQAIEILKDRKREKEENNNTSAFVFPMVKETNEKTKRVWSRVHRSLKKWAQAAGIDPKLMHFHTGRHTFATNVLENSPDGDLYTVSKLLGHKTIAATQIYAKVRDSRKNAAVKALPKLNLPSSNAA